MKRDQGQLALGLAFMFTASLAVFTLVLQSSLLTREKMQLQQTNDLAALMASDVQRNYLNQIRELNRWIEDEYKDLQTWLKINPYPSMAAMCWDYEVAGTFATMFSAASKEEKEADTCNKGCGGFDSYMKGMRIAQFQAAQTNYAKQIVALIQEANQNAFDLTLKTYLKPVNMPAALRGFLENKLGRMITLKDVQAEYAKGALKGIYDVIPISKDTWLFDAKVEERVFPVDHWAYNTIYFDGAPVGCNPLYAYPLPQPSLAKIYRQGTVPSNYLAGVQYTPITSESVKKFADYGLHLRDPQRTDGSKSAENVRGKAIPLFRDRQVMTALSLAKPFGGSYPAAGVKQQPLGGMGDRGSPGEGFEGSKLAGLADQRELGGLRLNLDQEFVMTDLQGRIRESLKSYTEDYLH